MRVKVRLTIRKTIMLEEVTIAKRHTTFLQMRNSEPRQRKIITTQHTTSMIPP